MPSMSLRRPKGSKTNDLRPANVARFAPALRLLLAAGAVARGSRPAWTEAVALAELVEAGVKRADLRAMVRAGLVRHAEDQTRPSSARRKFAAVRTDWLPER